MITGRRHVNNEIIEFAPLHVREKLFDEAVQDRAPHDHGFVARLQESHGHYLYAISFDWHQFVAFDNGLRIAGAEQQKQDYEGGNETATDQCRTSLSKEGPQV